MLRQLSLTAFLCVFCHSSLGWSTPPDASRLTLRPMCYSTQTGKILWTIHFWTNNGQHYVADNIWGMALQDVTNDSWSFTPMAKARIVEDSKGAYALRASALERQVNLATLINSVKPTTCAGFDGRHPGRGLNFSYSIRGDKLRVHLGKLTQRTGTRVKGPNSLRVSFRRGGAWKPIKIQWSERRRRADFAFDTKTDSLLFFAEPELEDEQMVQQDSYILVKRGALDATHSTLLNRRGYRHHKKAKYDLALRDFHRAWIFDPKNETAAYNVACAAARLKDTDLALKALATLVKKPELAQRIAKEADFDTIRKKARFIEFVSKLK